MNKNPIQFAKRIAEKLQGISLWRWLLGYYILTACTAFFPLPQIARAVLVSPLFFLVPLGLGLWLLPRGSTLAIFGLRRGETLGISYFVGLLCLTALFVAREREILPAGDGGIWVTGIVVLSALGFVYRRQMFIFSAPARDYLVSLLFAAPVFLASYGMHFFVFSDYPYTDLYQYTHIMKGAEEFARFDRLNPFTADSYIPVLQITYGIMIRFFGFDLMGGYWAMPVAAHVFRVLIYYVLAIRLFTNTKARHFFVAVLVGTLGALAPTNGDLVMLGSLLIFSMLLPANYTSEENRKDKLASIAVLCSIFVSYWLARMDAIGLPVLIIALSIIMAVFGRFFPSWGRLLLVVQLALALTPMHRATLVFVPFVVAIFFLLSVMGRWTRLRDAMVKLSTLLAVLITATIFLVWLFLDPENQYWYWFTPLAAYFIPWISAENLDVAPGMGSKVALFELVRLVGTWLAIATVVGIWLMSGKLGRTIEDSYRVLGITWQPYWVVAVLIACFILIGLPFTYRAGFMIVVMLAAVWAMGVFPHRAQNFWAWSAIIYIGVLVLLEYVMPGQALAHAYIDRIQPFTVLLVLILLTIGIWLLASHRRSVMAVVVLLLGVLVYDRQVMHARFMHYAYGNSITQTQKSISHYDQDDLAAAKWLRAYNSDLILVSDPITLANLRAFTGQNSIVSFSNLDTMPVTTSGQLKVLLREYLDQAAHSAKDESECNQNIKMINFLTYSGFSAETNYILYRWINPGNDGVRTLAALGYKPGLIISSDATPVIKASDHRWILDAANKQRGQRGSQDAANILRGFTVILMPRTYAWVYSDSLYIPRYAQSEKSIYGSIAQHLVISCNAVELNGRLLIAPPVKSEFGANS
jgi:hypothetical protein